MSTKNLDGKTVLTKAPDGRRVHQRLRQRRRIDAAQGGGRRRRTAVVRAADRHPEQRVAPDVRLTAVRRGGPDLQGPGHRCVWRCRRRGSAGYRGAQHHRPTGHPLRCWSRSYTTNAGQRSASTIAHTSGARTHRRAASSRPVLRPDPGHRRRRPEAPRLSGPRRRCHRCLRHLGRRRDPCPAHMPVGSVTALLLPDQHRTLTPAPLRRPSRREQRQCRSGSSSPGVLPARSRGSVCSWHRGGSSAGQSSGLIIRQSWVRAPPAPLINRALTRALASSTLGGDLV